MGGSAVANLDRVFSEFIRLRDADSNGYCRCITSGRVAHWKMMDAGHFISRSHMCTRWDERNVHAQSRIDNRCDSGNIKAYEIALSRKYGPEVVQELKINKHCTCKFSKVEIEEMIKHYKMLVRNLKKQKE